MGYVLSQTYDFAGTATVKGAAINGYTQTEVFSAPYFRTNGSGSVIADTPSGFPCYLHSAADISSDKHAAEIDFVWDNTNNFIQQVLGRFVNTEVGGGQYKGYRVWLRAFGGATSQLMIRVAGGNTSGFADVAITNGTPYTLRIEIEEGSPNTIRAKLWAQATPGSLIANVSVTDNTADYAGSTGRALGFAAEGSSYITANWAVDELRVYNWDYGDVTAPTVSGAVVEPSGNQITLTLTDASLPIITSTVGPLSGFTVSADGGDASVLSAKIVTPKITLALDRVILNSETVTVDYDGGSVDITDSSENLNPLAAFSSQATTNNSTQTSSAASTKGTGVMGTRGYVNTYANGSGSNKEVASQFRVDFPDGGDVDLVAVYGNLLNGRTIHISRAMAIIFQPNQPEVRMWMTFNNGSDTPANLAYEDTRETDPIPLSLLPGSYVRFVTKANFTSGTGVPSNGFSAYGATGTTSPEADVWDGAMDGTIGSITDAQLWTWNGTGSSTEASAGLAGIQRLFRPWYIKGKPHPTYNGTEIVLASVGDSICAGQNDWKTDGTVPLSGYTGRWAQKDVPSVTVGFGGGVAGGLMSLAGQAWFDALFGSTDRSAPRLVTHAVDEYGINKARVQTGVTQGTMASLIWADREAMAAIFVARGIPYVHMTLTPMGDFGTWLTGNAAYGNSAAQQAQFVADRAEFNTDIRTISDTITGCIGFIDLAHALESDSTTNGNTVISGRNSGDQLHPNGDGHIAVAGEFGTIFNDNPNPLPTYITITTDQLPHPQYVMASQSFGVDMGTDGEVLNTDVRSDTGTGAAAGGTLDIGGDNPDPSDVRAGVDNGAGEIGTYKGKQVRFIRPRKKR